MTADIPLLGHDARCAWMGYWRSNGPEGRAQALRVLEEPRSWPYATTEWTVDTPAVMAEPKSGKSEKLVQFHKDFCAVLPKATP